MTPFCICINLQLQPINYASSGGALLLVGKKKEIQRKFNYTTCGIISLPLKTGGLLNVGDKGDDSVCPCVAHKEGCGHTADWEVGHCLWN